MVNKKGENLENTLYSVDNKVSHTNNYNSWNKPLDAISSALTVASLVPGVDTIADIAAIPVDLLRGDFSSAALDLIGAIPLIGEIADTAKIAKFADKTIDAIKVSNKSNNAIKGVYKAVGANKSINKVTNATNFADNTINANKISNKAIETTKTIKNISPSQLTQTQKLTLSRTKYKFLFESIMKKGITEPIKYVEHNGVKYVVDGHHRLHIAKHLNLKDVPIEKVSLPYKGYKTFEDLFWLD